MCKVLQIRKMSVVVGFNVLLPTQLDHEGIKLVVAQINTVNVIVEENDSNKERAHHPFPEAIARIEINAVIYDDDARIP